MPVSRRAAKPRRFLAATALIVLCAALSGCDLLRAPQSFVAPASPVARAQSGLFLWSVWLCLGIFAVVVVGLVYILWRYRGRPDQKLPYQDPGDHRFEVVWTAVPIIIIILLAVPTVRTAYYTHAVPPGSDPLRIDVTANQFWWEFVYPDLGIVTANELHVPVNRVVYFSLTSNDVIHSFWFPRLAGKMEASPGKETGVWFEVEEPGLYVGQCGEYCGTSHANMRLRLRAHTEEEFGEWVRRMQDAAGNRSVLAASGPAGAGNNTVLAASEPPASQEGTGASGGPSPPGSPVPADQAAMIARGRQIFAESACAACHTLADAGTRGRVGPNLDNFGLRETIGAGIFPNTPENLKRWLRDPQAMKPGNAMPALGLTEEQIDALTAYLLSLK